MLTSSNNLIFAEKLNYFLGSYQIQQFILWKKALLLQYETDISDDWFNILWYCSSATKKWRLQKSSPDCLDGSIIFLIFTERFFWLCKDLKKLMKDFPTLHQCWRKKQQPINWVYKLWLMPSFPLYFLLVALPSVSLSYPPLW